MRPAKTTKTSYFDKNMMAFPLLASGRTVSAAQTAAFFRCTGKKPLLWASPALFLKKIHGQKAILIVIFIIILLIFGIVKSKFKVLPLILHINSRYNNKRAEVREEKELLCEETCSTGVFKNRITELREQRGVQNTASLELEKRLPHIRSITCGSTLPSLKELFNIFTYFEISPPDFFAGLEDRNSLRVIIKEKLLDMDDEDLKKVSLFIDWIRK